MTRGDAEADRAWEATDPTPALDADVALVSDCVRHPEAYSGAAPMTLAALSDLLAHVATLEATVRGQQATIARLVEAATQYADSANPSDADSVRDLAALRAALTRKMADHE